MRFREILGECGQVLIDSRKIRLTILWLFYEPFSFEKSESFPPFFEKKFHSPTIQLQLYPKKIHSWKLCVFVKKIRKFSFLLIVTNLEFSWSREMFKVCLVVKIHFEKNFWWENRKKLNKIHKTEKIYKKNWWKYCEISSWIKFKINRNFI